MKCSLSTLYDDRKWRFLILFAITLLWNLLFQTSVSPLIYSDDGDSIVYREMGLALLQGKELYVDLFDHKGPVIYFINFLGSLFGNGRWGLFLLHVLNYTIAAYIWSKIVSFFVTGIKAIYPIILTIVTLVALCTAGNSSEDWCVIPISYALYLGVYALLKPREEEISLHSVIVLGICAAVIFFIRANNAAIVLCAFLLLLFTERDQRIKVLTGTSIGFMGVAVLVISFFYLSGGYDYVSNMLYGTLFYNLEYAANKISSGSMFESFRFICIIYLALVLGAFYVIKKEERNTRMIVYIVVCFLLSFLTMGKNNFAHYLIVIIPLFALLSSLAIPKAHVHLASITFIIVAALFMKFPVGMVHSIIVNRPINEKFYTEADAVISRIPHDERTKIWNYSTIYSAPSILYRNGIVQCNRIFHNFQLDFSEKLREECENELPIKSPAWIIIDGSSNVSAQDSMYIADNYQLDEVVSSNDMNLNVMFYKRK